MIWQQMTSQTTLAIHLTFLCHRLTPVTGFVGDQSDGVTPDPFPNSVVKPITPMILQQRESRSLPTYEPRRLNAFEALFIYTPSVCRSGRPCERLAFHVRPCQARSTDIPHKVFGVGAVRLGATIFHFIKFSDVGMHARLIFRVQLGRDGGQRQPT